VSYKFVRYVDGKRMAEGALIHNASSYLEAYEKAVALFEPDATPGEMDRTTFELVPETNS
jgi:hypothetical protein